MLQYSFRDVGVPSFSAPDFLTVFPPPVLRLFSVPPSSAPDFLTVFPLPMLRLCSVPNRRAPCAHLANK